MCYNSSYEPWSWSLLDLNSFACTSSVNLANILINRPVVSGCLVQEYLIQMKSGILVLSCHPSTCIQKNEKFTQDQSSTQYKEGTKVYDWEPLLHRLCNDLSNYQISLNQSDIFDKCWYVVDSQFDGQLIILDKLLATIF